MTPRSRSLLALTLVVLLASFAGCSSALSGESAPDRDAYGVDDELASALDSDDGQPDEPATQLLPGLTVAGLENSEELLEAHREAIGDRSYTIRAEVTVENVNGTGTYTVVRTTHVDPASGTAFERTERESDWPNDSDHFYASVPNETVEIWYGDGEGLVRTEHENGSVEYGGSVSQSYDVRRNVAGRLEQQMLYSVIVVDESETTVVATNASDGRYYVVVGEQIEETDDESFAERLSTRLFVREDGLLRQSVVEGTLIERDGGRDVVDTITIADVGETTVDRPEWYEDALEAVDDSPDEEPIEAVDDSPDEDDDEDEDEHRERDG